MSESIDCFSRFHQLNDEDWLEVLLKTARGEDVFGLPGFPPEEIQTNFVGSHGETALREGHRFYALLKKYGVSLQHSLNIESKVLDFGVGWGRLIRFFLKDVPVGNLFGVDVDPDVLKMCRETGISANLDVIKPSGVLPFAEDTFDFIYAYSVFSHLSEKEHMHWLGEISRVLRPGGIFVATTEARHFIDFCASLTEETATSNWHRTLLAAFPDPGKTLQDYDAGRFVFAPTGGGDYRSREFYGETAIPRKYVEEYWTRYFDFRDFVDDESRFWQAVIVMQQPSGVRFSSPLKILFRKFFARDDAIGSR